jgi:mannose-6-phosphate isomerase-like protein (cupin superfamily)
MHPAVQGNTRQSLAEASILPGGATLLHRHRDSEELYHILSGTGRMTLGPEEFAIAPGDTVLIPPGTPHRLRNVGAEPLRLICACSPAYQHEDTEVLE